MSRAEVSILPKVNCTCFYAHQYGCDADDTANCLIQTLRVGNCLGDLQECRRGIGLLLRSIVQPGVFDSYRGVICESGGYRLGLVSIPSGGVVGQGQYSQRAVTRT